MLFTQLLLPFLIFLLRAPYVFILRGFYEIKKFLFFSGNVYTYERAASNRCCIVVVVIDKSSYVNSVYPCVHAWVSVCEEIKVKA